MMDKIKTALPWFLGIVALIAIGACVWLYLHPRTTTLTKTEYQPVPLETVVTKVVKVPYMVKVPIKVYDKQALAAALPAGVLPAALTAALVPAGAAPLTGGVELEGGGLAPSPSETQIIANGKVEPSDNATSLFTVLDTNTGEASIIARELPAPFFAFENHGQLAGWYGYNQRAQPVFQADAQWAFLRVKELHLGLKAQGSTDSVLFGGAGVLYKW